MKRFFWNAQERRPRVFWRLIIQLLVWNLLILVLLVPYSLLNDEPITFGLLLFDSPAGIRMVSLLVSVYLMARFIDVRHFSDYGLEIRDKEWWKDLGLGLVLGMLTITIMFGAMYGLGWVEVVDTLHVPEGDLVTLTLGGALMLAIAAAVYEMLYFWSYALRNLSEGMIYLNRLNGRIPVVGALVLCLIYFVLFAMRDAQNVDLVFVSNTFRAGILLALPFILTQRLGMSIGLFLGWSALQLNIYGLRAVGADPANPSLLIIIEKGPDLWTGGDVGLTNGLMAMIALLILSGIITMWDKRRTGQTMFDGSMAFYTPRDTEPVQPALDPPPAE